jgi:hypothetical protein
VGLLAAALLGAFLPLPRTRPAAEADALGSATS